MSIRNPILLYNFDRQMEIVTRFIYDVCIQSQFWQRHNSDHQYFTYTKRSYFLIFRELGTAAVH